MPNLRKYGSILIIGIGLLIDACVEPIDFETDPAGGQLIVTGGITNAKGAYEVTLKRTANLNRTFPVPEGGAQITLRNDRGQQEAFREQDGGVYRTAGVVQGQPGETYEIEIVLADGTTYRSRPETMPTAIGKDSAYYEIGKQEKVSDSGVLFEDRVVEVYVDTQLPENEPTLYLKWDLETVYSVTTIIRTPLSTSITYCYFFDYPDAQTVRLFNRQELPGGEVLRKQFLGARGIDYSFLERHYFNVIQSSLTAEAYQYWQQVGDLSNRTGSVFDTPPGLIRGNVYNVEDEREQVLGYFEAAQTDTSRFFLTRTDLPVTIGANCPCTSLFLNLDQTNLPFTVGSLCPCTLCSELPGVTLDPPSYW